MVLIFFIRLLFNDGLLDVVRLLIILFSSLRSDRLVVDFIVDFEYSVIFG